MHKVSDGRYEEIGKWEPTPRWRQWFGARRWRRFIMELPALAGPGGFWQYSNRKDYPAVTNPDTLESISGRARQMVEARDMEIKRLRMALERIISRQFDMDVVPLQKISSRFRELVQIARDALKE